MPFKRMLRDLANFLEMFRRTVPRLYCFGFSRQAKTAVEYINGLPSPAVLIRLASLAITAVRNFCYGIPRQTLVWVACATWIFYNVFIRIRRRIRILAKHKVLSAIARFYRQRRQDLMSFQLLLFVVKRKKFLVDSASSYSIDFARIVRISRESLWYASADSTGRLLQPSCPHHFAVRRVAHEMHSSAYDWHAQFFLKEWVNLNLMKIEQSYLNFTCYLSEQRKQINQKGIMENKFS